MTGFSSWNGTQIYFDANTQAVSLRRHSAFMKWATSAALLLDAYVATEWVWFSCRHVGRRYEEWATVFWQFQRFRLKYIPGRCFQCKLDSFRWNESGLSSKGGRASNCSFGIYMNSQGGVWQQYVGSHIQSNGASGIGNADGGGELQVQDNYLAGNTGYGYVQSAAAFVQIITGNQAVYNSVNGFSGVSTDSTHICANNIGGGGC